MMMDPQTLRRLFNHLKKNTNLIISTDDNCRISLEQFSHGQSNPTYKLKIQSTSTTSSSSSSTKATFVLRKKPDGRILASAHAVEREFRIQNQLSQFTAGKFPVPRMIYLCEDTNVIGTQFYIMSFVKGEIFEKPKLPMIDSVQRREKIYKQMAKTLGELHAFDDMKAIGLERVTHKGR
jgi:acyl-CoA dehydrogenase